MKRQNANNNGEQQPNAEDYNSPVGSTLSPEAQARTTEARSSLYNLIARFRTDAAKTDDKEAKSIFEFAAEVIAGLTRGFREFQERRSPDTSSNSESGSERW